MKLSNAQFGALSTLNDYGQKAAIEVIGPPAMNGNRYIKLECHFMATKTMAALEEARLIHVARQPGTAPKDAVGRKGKTRRKVIIAITDKGRAALSACMKVG